MDHVFKTTLFHEPRVQNGTFSWTTCSKRHCLIDHVFKTALFHKPRVLSYPLPAPLPALEEQRVLGCILGLQIKINPPRHGRFYRLKTKVLRQVGKLNFCTLYLSLDLRDKGQILQRGGGDTSTPALIMAGLRSY